MFNRMGPIFLFIMITTLSSCGQKINPDRRGSYAEAEISYLLIEKQCSDQEIEAEPVSLEIAKVYNEFQLHRPFAFFDMPVRLYDYKTPLIISLDEMEKQLTAIKIKINDLFLLPDNTRTVAEELYYLFYNSKRFEGQKCSFPHMIQKKYTEIRPYLEMLDFCNEKNGTAFCSLETMMNLSKEEEDFVEERTLKLCKAFDPSDVNCRAQYTLRKKNKTIPSLVALYQKKFEEERYQKLFRLRESHLMFQCQKNEDVTIMTLKVHSQKIDAESLRILTDFVSESWSRENFELNIELVDVMGSDVIEILPSTTGVSYVPDNNNRKVFLSQQLDFETQKKILAHEFGHVLGFPDCYTEFFDNQTKELVYYEISKEDTNIMCSLKKGVSVPDDYLSQLAQNSCVFN